MSNKSTIKTHSLGSLRIGAKRELKKATEAYWQGGLPLYQVIETRNQLQANFLFELPNSNHAHAKY